MELREERRKLSMLYGYVRGTSATLSCFEGVATECFETGRRSQRQDHRRSLRPKWQPWEVISDSPFMGDWTSTCCPRTEQCERDCPGLRVRILTEWISTDSSRRYTLELEMDERLICCAGAYQRWVDKGYEVRFTHDQHTRCESVGNVQPETRPQAVSTRQVAIDHFVGALERPLT